MNKPLLRTLVALAVGLGAATLALRTIAAAEAPAADAPAKPDAQDKNPLHLPPAKREAAGLVLAKPTAATLAPEVEAYGRVIDPAPFVALLAERETAQAALAASQKELARTQILFQQGGNASAQAVETAEANVGRDRAALSSARLRLLAGWGKDVAAQADDLRNALEQGATLARLDVLPGSDPVGGLKSVSVRLAGAQETAEAEVLGIAPVADPQVQGRGLLVLLRRSTLSVGAALRATLPGIGSNAPALVVPRGAIVYFQGSAWAYVLGEKDTLERKLVTLGRTVPQGIAIVSGIDADDQVVTTGAEQLLAAELQSAGGGDEG